MTIIVSNKGEYFTVADLKKVLAPLPDEVWVCLAAEPEGGPLRSFIIELGANEPFILLRNKVEE